MRNNAAFLFPGQGSQAAGMLAEHMVEPVVADTFAEAGEVLGYDMAALVRDNPQDRLNATEYTQPALLTASTALLRLWRARKGPEAGHVAGHSLGEYSALVAAGSLTFADALRLVAFRGEVMSKAVPAGEGRMAAILGLSSEAVAAFCEEVSGDFGRVWPANDNCPGQLVVAGHRRAVEAVMRKAEQAGARRVVPLDVSVPSHTPLMQPAAAAMRERLAETALTDADRAVWSNAWARPVRRAAEIRAALVEQLVLPVRWTQLIRAMHAQGVVAAVEMGPGKVLAGLVRRIERGMTVHGTETPARLSAALAGMGGSDG